MPPRNNRNTLVNKQKKLIENRLIQISMIVDDDIYQNKPLSSATAEMYMREVHSYKDKCFEDLRCLQVIEKLIRLMKGIIMERGQNEINLDDLNNLPNTKVFSVLDNIGQSPQNAKHSRPKATSVTKVRRSVKNKTLNKDEIMNTRGKRKRTMKNLISQDSDIIDLCIDDDQGYNNKNVAKSHDEIKNVDKVASLPNDLSNLLITNLDIQTPSLITEECSQSILSGFNQVLEPINNSNNKYPTDKASCLKPMAQMQDTRPVTDRQTVLSQEKVTNDIKATNIITLELQKYEDSVINNKITDEINYNNITNYYNPNSKLIIYNPSQNDMLIPEPTTNFTKQINKRQPVTKMTKTEVAKVKKPKANKRNNKNNATTMETSRNQQRKVENKKVNKAFTVEKFRNNQIKEDNKNGNALILENRSNNQNKVNKRGPKTYLKTSKVDLKATIYNNLIENDLSWMENIRYVREIAKDEYESVILGDNFWENYALPDNWNNDDFLY